MTAVAATAASAAKPEFIFTGTAKENKEFTATQIGSSSLVTTAGETVTCSGGSGLGEIEGISGSKKVTSVVVTFTGCAQLAVKCQSGPIAGQIVTRELTGTLVYLDKSKTKVGVLIKPKVAPTLAEFECTGFVKWTVTGELLCEIAPKNKPVTSPEFFTVTCEQKGGIQKWTKIEEEGVEHSLKVFGKQAALEAIYHVSPRKPGQSVEISA
jgi:hypothetical protein